MDRDRELWACALILWEKHGDEAPIVIAERLGAMALANDEPAIATWQDIAQRVQQLMQGEGITN